MSRSLSQVAREAINAQETGEVFLILLRIDHETLSQPIRVVRNNENITSNGSLYAAYPFDVELPDEMPEGMPTVTLRIDNIGEVEIEGEQMRLVELIRSIRGRPSVDLEVVLASSPDVIEAGPFSLTLYDVTYDSVVIEGTLAFEDTLNAAYPGKQFTPETAPGLF